MDSLLFVGPIHSGDVEKMKSDLTEAQNNYLSCTERTEAAEKVWQIFSMCLQSQNRTTSLTLEHLTGKTDDFLGMKGQNLTFISLLNQCEVWLRSLSVEVSKERLDMGSEDLSLPDASKNHFAGKIASRI